MPGDRFNRVKVTNEGRKTFVGAWNGEEFEIPPGESIVVDEFIAHHWVGDPEKLAKQENAQDEIERKRVMMRDGSYPGHDVAEYEKVRPKLKIELVPGKKGSLIPRGVQAPIA